MAGNERVEFSAFDGTTLRGNFFLPEQKNAPCIIMAAGLTFLKEHLGNLPNQLQDAGFAVLAYDHRSFGSSDGEPRQHADLYQQSNDCSDAITFVSNQSPTVDPKQIWLWGGGHAGGVIMPVGVTDSRVKGLLVILPFFSGRLDFKAWPNGHAERLWRERVETASKKGGWKEPIYVPIFPESVDAAKANPKGTVIGRPQAVAFHEGSKSLSDAAATPWDNKITLQSLYHQRRWEPTAFLPQLTVPLLYITARYDEFTPHEEHMAAYEKAGGPKELVTFDSQNLEAFANPELRNRQIDRILDFVKRYS